MQFLNRMIPRNPPSTTYTVAISKCLRDCPFASNFENLNSRVFSSDSQIEGDQRDNRTDENFDWNDTVSSWSSGLVKAHFDGEAVGHQVIPTRGGDSVSVSKSQSVSLSDDHRDRTMKKQSSVLDRQNRRSIDGWDERMVDTRVLLKRVREPGARGSYLKDSEKAEMYRLHKENPEVYTIERLAKDYRVMRQRVHAILWLKGFEEEEAKRRGQPLDDSVELLLDNCPEYFKSHDREFHVAPHPYKPDFKVMPEGWDSTTKDLGEEHYEISKKQDDMLYEEFVQRFNLNKMKFKGDVKEYKYSRKHPSDGWPIVVEKMGPQGKRGSGGGFKSISEPDGSTRPLNEMEKMYVKREAPRRRRRILP